VRKPLFRAVAKCHLNFYPGTMIPTPAEYRHVVETEPIPYVDALRLIFEWRGVVSDPNAWQFSVEPYESEGPAVASAS